MSVISCASGTYACGTRHIGFSFSGLSSLHRNAYKIEVLYV
jgi:hypothetical protein